MKYSIKYFLYSRFNLKLDNKMGTDHSYIHIYELKQSNI